MLYAGCRWIPTRLPAKATTTGRRITSARWAARRSSMETPVSTPASREVVDPVCGMTIDPADAVGHVDYEGHTYYFCADSCLERFTAEPARYVTPGFGIRDSGFEQDGTSRIPNPQSRIPTGASKWTCPMHPEIVRDG